MLHAATDYQVNELTDSHLGKVKPADPGVWADGVAVLAAAAAVEIGKELCLLATEATRAAYHIHSYITM